MAKIREEIVGKRFLSVSSGSKLKLSKINEWDWRAGVIRACTHTDSKHPDLQVLVEYDDVEWQRREWVHVYRGQLFQIFLLEKTLAWATRTPHSKMRGTPIPWPALVYVGLVDQAGISEHKYRPVEYLVDRTLDYHDYTQLQPYQDGECAIVCGEECGRAVRAWVGEQDGQRILLTTPSVLVGFRVQVYRAEGTTQWYTAVIVGYNHATRELTVTDDTVLEEHSEDPSLVQIRLIGEGGQCLARGHLCLGLFIVLFGLWASSAGGLVGLVATQC
ncbi:probable JmjC domain-containing histone demethylation protein 2C [Penaeus vannamei]|uniref:probable JmjC domain-containing histone demethylation protein 2C n=1 Tax=Penaeus vannamei TaxID=6689 RepID=UPI00387F60F6